MAVLAAAARCSSVWLRRRDSMSLMTASIASMPAARPLVPGTQVGLGVVGLPDVRSKGNRVRAVSRVGQDVVDQRMRAYQLQVPGSAEGKSRLDVYLVEAVPDVTRARLQGCIKEGLVTVNGTPRGKPGFKVKAGDQVEFTLQPLKPLNAEPEDIPLDIVYEDEQLLVINKEPGMVTHPAPGNYSGTLVNAVLNHCSLPQVESAYDFAEADESDEEEGEGAVGAEEARVQANSAGVIRPGIVHRLDKGTSGLLVVAKTEAALQGLATQFKERTVERTYVSITLGKPKASKGRVETNIARDPHDRKRMAAFPYQVDGGAGRHAASNYKVVEELADGRAAVVAWKLDTGRTHQIRVHAKEIGHPLLGDDTYGGGAAAAADRLSRGSAVIKERVMGIVEEFGRPALHAATLGFTHPASGEFVKFSAPVPVDMTAVVEALRGDMHGGEPTPP